jgi:hypothetical protein
MVSIQRKSVPYKVIEKASKHEVIFVREGVAPEYKSDCRCVDIHLLLYHRQK